MDLTQIPFPPHLENPLCTINVHKFPLPLHIYIYNLTILYIVKQK